MLFVLIQTQQKDAHSKRGLEHETAVKQSLEEVEARNKQVAILEQQVKDLEHKLELADAKLKEKVCSFFFISTASIFISCND